MRRRLLVLLVPFVLLAAACSNDGSPTVKGPKPTARPTSTSAPTTTSGPGTTQKSPGATVTTTPPGPGIALSGPVGSGTFTYSLSSARSELCYRLSVKGIGKPTAAHIVRSTGEVVLDLTPPAEDATVNTCAAADSLFVDEVQSTPSHFGVSVSGPAGTLKATLK
jgi:hypothetical protein